MRSRWGVVCALAVGLIGGGGAMAVAGPTGANEQIRGCVGKKGALRVLSGGATRCARGETPIAWNRVGPAGAKGDPGAAGPKGDAGAIGDRGPQGEAGAAGAAGERGPRGEAGATGERGPQGEVGPRGPEGPVGQTLRWFDGSANSVETVSRTLAPVSNGAVPHDDAFTRIEGSAFELALPARSAVRTVVVRARIGHVKALCSTWENGGYTELRLVQLSGPQTLELADSSLKTWDASQTAQRVAMGQFTLTEAGTYRFAWEQRTVNGEHWISGYSGNLLSACPNQTTGTSADREAVFEILRAS